MTEVEYVALCCERRRQADLLEIARLDTELATARAEIERMRADLDNYRAAAAAHLRYDMASIVTGTPEQAMATELTEARAEIERMRAVVIAADEIDAELYGIDGTYEHTREALHEALEAYRAVLADKPRRSEP
jgi:D-mannonate dehydratase